jgi:hypothetical protein
VEAGAGEGALATCGEHLSRTLAATGFDPSEEIDEDDDED